MAKTDDPRMKKALEMLQAIEDKDAADAVVSVLNELAPDYARATIAYAFGDTYARTKQLALRDREITTLAAMGNALPQLKVHIRSGLKVGLSQQEIVEIIGHVGVYAGFPVAANAYFAMKEALAESAAARQAAVAKGGAAGKAKSVKAKAGKAASAAKAKPAKTGKKG